MIHEIDGLLSDIELNFLDEKCKNFNEDFTNRGTNFYHRMFIDENSCLLDFQSKLKTYIYDKFKVKHQIKSIWINKITADTNKNDPFHLDEEILTVVTYINTNFDGGEFEYFSKIKPNKKIKPKRNLSLIMNNKVPHKVLPVKNGERYSLVCFYYIPEKNVKSLL